MKVGEAGEDHGTARGRKLALCSQSVSQITSVSHISLSRFFHKLFKATSEMTSPTYSTTPLPPHTPHTTSLDLWLCLLSSCWDTQNLSGLKGPRLQGLVKLSRLRQTGSWAIVPSWVCFSWFLTLLRIWIYFQCFSRQSHTSPTKCTLGKGPQIYC